MAERKIKEISQENKNFFRAGLLEGNANKSVLKEALNTMMKTNRELYHIIMELDKVEPVVGVLLTFKLAKSALVSANANHTNYDLAKKIQVCIDKARVNADMKVLTALTQMESDINTTDKRGRKPGVQRIKVKKD